MRVASADCMKKHLNRWNGLCGLMLALAAPFALAQETGQQIGVSGQNLPRAQVDVYKSPQQFTISPGIISYQSENSHDESRLSISGLLTRNFSNYSVAPSPIQYGLEGGLTYSHLGAPG